MNFELHADQSRRGLRPVLSLTNGCFIIDTKLGRRLGSYIGENPFPFPLDSLAAIEIKDILSLSMANDLLALYFRQTAE